MRKRPVGWNSAPATPDQSGPETVAALAGDTPVVRPEFGAGDVLFFDDLFLHRTAVSPEMTKDRYAIESWCFAPSAYPPRQVPALW